jgi:hypothetical protein
MGYKSCVSFQMTLVCSLHTAYVRCVVSEAGIRQMTGLTTIFMARTSQILLVLFFL